MRALVVALLAALALTGVAAADTQIWNAAFIQARPGATGVTGWLDLHARRRADGTLFIVRPGIGYTFSKSLAVFVGYAYVPISVDDADDRTEQRVWQQVVYTSELNASTKVQGRARLEQRFGLVDGDDLGHRVRLLGRAQWSSSRLFSLIAWDELFLGLNDTMAFTSGFDQNRLFLGVGADTLVNGVRVELGYMNIVRKVMDDTVTDHAVAANLYVTLTP